MRKSIIAAFDKNRLVGAEGKMPWNLPGDMKRFRDLTMGKPMIMGRKTLESIGKPLAGRENIVLSRNPSFSAPGCTVARSLRAAFDLAEATGADEVMVIGGSVVYAEAIHYVDRMYLTMIRHAFPNERKTGVFFPHAWPGGEEGWTLTSESNHLPDERNKYRYAFFTADRVVARAFEYDNSVGRPSRPSLVPA